MGQALQNYERSHNLHALQVTTTNCQVRLEEQGGEDYAGAEPPTPLAAHRLTADGTSVAAGGPSAAMPTATVRRGVAASDDRQRDATQLRVPRPRSATGTPRRLRRQRPMRRSPVGGFDGGRIVRVGGAGTEPRREAGRVQPIDAHATLTGGVGSLSRAPLARSGPRPALLLLPGPVPALRRSEVRIPAKPHDFLRHRIGCASYGCRRR